MFSLVIDDPEDPTPSDHIAGPHLTEIPPDTLLFRQIVHYCYENSRTYPYQTDFFHETKPVMKSILDKDVFGFAKGLYEQSGNIFKSNSNNNNNELTGITTEGTTSSTTISISTPVRFRIRKIKLNQQPDIVNRYSDRKFGLRMQFMEEGRGILPRPAIELAEVPGTIGECRAPQIDPTVNEYYLFSGHKKAIVKSIVDTGAKPHIGSYDSTKGFGALGRGAYYTDRIDKAISYSPCSVCGAVGEPCRWAQRKHDWFKNAHARKHYRRIVLNRVLLGMPLVVESGKKLRHSTHNSLVGMPLKGTNETVDVANEGKETTISEWNEYQSIIGKQTKEPGGSMLYAIYMTNLFDSNEFLVRNGDQVYPEFVIYYTITEDFPEEVWQG
jgi:hypothetical protein